MTQRIDYGKAAPEALAAMLGLDGYVRHCGLPRKLVELVRMRASQINGCAYCLDMHSKDARAIGETEQRLYVLSGWREAPFYDERERAALEWTEAITRIADYGVPDELYARVRRQFSEKEIVDLTLAVIVINGWNRLEIPFRSRVGEYQPKRT
ncbi:MAG: hypothetical protein NFCOHLIN_01985 [Gammaproteobacteria bacterium]|nr:hypothetical protein [Gammaproteobacteria bacterium]